jgi:hypothetical protein
LVRERIPILFEESLSRSVFLKSPLMNMHAAVSSRGVASNERLDFL